MFDRHQINVLIVDDNNTSLDILYHVLSKIGFRNIRKSSNAKEALRAIETHRPEVIFTDILMPDLSGYELIRMVRKMPADYHPMIIAITALNIPEERVRIFEYGADELILKPINRNEIDARLGLLLERNKLVYELQAYQDRTAQALNDARSMLESLTPSQHALDDVYRRQRLILSSHYMPTHEIGGDLWGMKPINDTLLAIYIYDFIGHGIAAALQAFRFHSLIETTLSDGFFMPDDVMPLLNRKLHAILPRGQFATMFYGLLDIDTQQLHFTCASTPAPFIMRHETGLVDALDGKGLPLGIVPDHSYTTQTAPFHRQDTLLLYSDALIETPKRHENAFLTEHDIIDTMKAELGHVDALSHHALMKRLIESLKPTIQDDLTICLLSKAA